MTELGFTEERLFSLNPALIYVAMPGFGKDGPLSTRVAFGPTVEAMSGLSQMFSYDGNEPRNSAMALMDPIAGMNAVAAICQALNQVKKDGVGTKVECSLHEAGVSYQGPWLVDAALGNIPRAWGNRHPELVPHGVFPARAAGGTDQWVAVACLDDHQWSRLAEVLDLDKDMTLDERRAHEDAIETALAAYTAQFEKHACVQRLQDLGVAAGAVNDASDLFADPQANAREFFVPLERHATPMPGCPMEMSGVDPSTWTPCPDLGEHNAEVLRDWLGYDEAEIERLKKQAVVHDRPPG